jgi:hypothetical protein
VKNEDYIKPNLYELESLRSELIEKTLSTSSNNLRLFLYQNYFEKILSLNNPNIEEAFLKEFLDDYTSCICKFEPWGVEPAVTMKLLEQFKKISISKITSENLTSLNYEVDRIEKQFEKLNLILEGKIIDNDEMQKAFFPLIDKQAPNGFYGIIESVTVRISKTAGNDKFIIVPSEIEIEKRILEQCKLSWLAAFQLSRHYVKKPNKHHEVIINFDKRVGFYEGNSLGIALALAFLKQILKFYNPAYIINIKEQSAFTGGVTEAGEVLCTSEEIIKRKVAAVFFSKINTFVFPKCEETYAYFALTQLKKNYPNRKLKLIPVEDINDVINRRDVVDIKKQKLVVRTGKFVKKNWISAVTTILLAIVFAYLFVMDFDDNPAAYSVDGKFVYIKNTNGKILWKKNYLSGIDQIKDIRLTKNYIKILDIDNDNRNEIIINTLYDKDLMAKPELNCYDYKGIKRWSYIFKDKVQCKREVLETGYGITILDTLFIGGKNRLMLSANSSSSFNSAIFSIDLKTGERLDGTFWSSGHTVEVLFLDLDNDKRKELIGFGWDNGYEDVALFAKEIDTLTTVRKSIDSYLIQNYPLAKMIAYVRIPKTDFENYYAVHRTSSILGGSFCFLPYEKMFSFNLLTSDVNIYIGYGLYFDRNLKAAKILIANDFRIARDTLVSHHKLSLPYTDTEEYKTIIMDNILYYKDGKWVNRKGIEKE